MTEPTRLSLLALEPRLVFDGAMVFTFEDGSSQDTRTDTESTAATSVDPAPWSELDQHATLPDTDPASLSPPRREIVFVDDGIDRLDSLLSALNPEVERVVIRSGEDGLAQVLAHLSERQSYDAIHLFGHGSAGLQRLGSTELSADSLQQADGTLAVRLQVLGDYLTSDADLLLYGCEVAQGDSGATLIRELARLTGADIAASSNITGTGGDWVLEQQTGVIEVQRLVPSAWEGRLGTLTVTGDDYNEASPVTGFSVTGFEAGYQLALSVDDITTTGVSTGTVKYTLDGGTTWKTYSKPISITSADMVASSGTMFVTVSSLAEQELSQDGQKEQFSLQVLRVYGDPTWQTETNLFIITTEQEFTQKSTISVGNPDLKLAVFDFNDGSSSGSKVPLYKGEELIGTISYSNVTAANVYGGANGSRFVTANNSNPVVIELSVPQNYMGMWWSAGDKGNILEFFDADGKLIETFKADLMEEPSFPKELFGNPNYNPQVVANEKYAFINFFMKDGLTFSKVVARGSNYESDNYTFTFVDLPSSESVSTLADDGTGKVIAVDEDGNALIGPNGFTPDPTVTPQDDTPISALTVTGSRVSEPAVAGTDKYLGFTVTGGNEGQQLKLELKNGTGTVGVDTTGPLQYFSPQADNGQGAWIDYSPATYIVVPADGDAVPDEAVELQVRVKIAYDDNLQPNEPTEVVTLKVTATDPAVTASAVGEILPSLQVSDVTVNEASPYAVFVVSAKPDAAVRLSVIPGVTPAKADLGPNGDAYADEVLEFYDPTAAGGTGGWVSYSEEDPPSTDGEGQLLLRVTISPDSRFEAAETLRMEVEYADNTASAVGTATILDDGTGDLFGEDNIDGQADLPGENGIPLAQVLDDDRPLVIDDVLVNEGSHYAVITIDAIPGYPIALSIDSGHAVLGQDAASTFEYFDPVFQGGQWRQYSGPIDVPDLGGPAYEAVPLLVRVAITQDQHFEGPESFTVTGQYTMGTRPAVTGKVTIVDDGTGDIFASSETEPGVDIDPTTGLLQAVVLSPAQAPRDDDRPLQVSGTTVAEASGQVYWSVRGEPGQALSLTVQSGTALLGTDTAAASALEVFDGTAWVPYVAGLALPASGEVQVRLAVDADNEAELAETVVLTARNGSGTAFEGISTIVDDGLAIPADEKPLSVVGQKVNEASPYLVFAVSGQVGQTAKLALDSATAAVGTDTGSTLQVLVGGQWVSYDPDQPPAVPATGDLLVRVAVTNDGSYEGEETVVLKVTTAGGLTSTGVGAIVDDGTGAMFASDNVSGLPDVPGAGGLPALNDDRAVLDAPPVVTSITVNEASPYAVFAVTGVPGAGVTLTLDGDTATAGEDYIDGLQVFDEAIDAWVAYDPAHTVVNPTGVLLVRVALADDAPFEGPETFKLQAQYNANGAVDPGNTSQVSGTATIVDDGTGLIFLTKPDDPATPANESNLGVNDAGLPELDRFSPLDDDRALAVSSVEVNEGSPYAVFSVTAVEGQALLLDLASGNATVGQDTGTQLQYFDGEDWVDYTPGESINVPAGRTEANNEAVSLLVRVAITQDIHFEGAESFTLQATYVSNGKTATGIGTIVDDGTGDIFAASETEPGVQIDPTTGLLEAVALTPAQAPRDDDRPLEVKGTTVGEASGQVYWSVRGEPGQALSLTVQSGTALLGTDTAATSALEVFDGSAWVPYVAGLALPASGEVQVRLAVTADNEAELAETLVLTASNASGAAFEGSSTIVDDGPVIPADEQPLSVVGQTVNEASPYLVFAVSGQTGQLATLALDSATAAVGTDTGSTLQVLVNGAWVSYDPSLPPAVPATGELLVRVAVSNDGSYEGEETLVLKATTAGGLTSTGVGAIVDDGTGAIFLGNNLSAEPNKIGEADPDGPDYPAQLNDDRVGNMNQPPVVNSFTVNEGSPYAVFTVTGVPKAGVTLTLDDGTATAGKDYVDSLQVFDEVRERWMAYDPATAVVGPQGTLLVRVALGNDAPFEGPETFSLQARYNANGEVDPGNTSLVSGTATIVDDGTGLIFLTQPDDPATPENESNLGVNDAGLPELDRFSPPDDDRPLGVSSVEVNEASPYAVFSVTAVEGQALLLDLASGNATVGQDTSAQLQYFDGEDWVGYTPGIAINVPGDGDQTANETVNLLVRVAITQDIHFEGAESFTLQATYASNGKTATGSGTILDDGTGNIFATRADDPNLAGDQSVTGVNPDGTATMLTAPRDDDRPLQVSGTTVAEASGQVYWSVRGEPGQALSLAVASGTALVGMDTAVSALQVFNGTDWVPYVAGLTLPASGEVQVRLAVDADNEAELAETVVLTARNGSGTAFEGSSTIVDDGLAIPADEKPLSVVGQKVNEASPYLVFAVSGQVGQTAKLALDSATAAVGTDTGSTLQVLVGGQWVSYDPDHLPAVPESGQLLVRVAVNNDGIYEGEEQLRLVATTAGGLVSTGVGAIVDDGTGAMFAFDNVSAVHNVPGTGGLPARNDDRAVLDAPPAVNSFTVNEGSPYAVFAVTGVPGAGVTLTLDDGSATAGEDYIDGLQVFDEAMDAWVAYDPAHTVVNPTDVLLVRVALADDAPFEGPETFRLQAQYNANGEVDPGNPSQVSGTATIIDDGTGLIFLTTSDAPLDPLLLNVPNNEGVNDLGLPEVNNLSPKNDDRALSIDDVKVNEGSPYAVFSVTAVEGQALLLDLASGKATVGQDTGTKLQYFDGMEWLDYTPGQTIAALAGGSASGNEAVSILVRVAITQDIHFEGAESFTLQATYASNGRTASGTGTIVDDGTGDIFAASETEPGVQIEPTTGLLEALALTPAEAPRDDDRPLQVSGTTVGEASGQVYWSVRGEPGQALSLTVASGTALLGTDTAAASALEVFDGTDWVPYVAGLTLPASGEVQVRLAVTADNEAELAETLVLMASNASGAAFAGSSTIVDDGPVIPAGEKPLSVVGQTVNEASPYLVFAVSGQAGQRATLALDSGTAAVGMDTTGSLQVLVGAQWVSYHPSQPPAVPATGELLVRVAVSNDGSYEGEETLVLKATTAGGLVSTGVGAIVDDGTGALFSANNITGEPDAPGSQIDLPATEKALNYDRVGNLNQPPLVNSFTVNEGSPFAVFTVTGVPGAGMTLSLDGDTATPDKDYVDSLQVFDEAIDAWVAYSPTHTVVNPTGVLLVRVALGNDVPFEGPETFSLQAQYNANGVVDPSNTSKVFGTATIVDDGTGLIFLTRPDDPGTPENEANLGVNDAGWPELDRFSARDDDRAPITIDNLEVNEGSPYAIFTVMAVEGQPVLLDLASGSARLGVDTGTQLEVLIGGQWQPYTPGIPVTVPAGGTPDGNETVPMLVRVAISNDYVFEEFEHFTLNAQYATGNQPPSEGRAVIRDDGEGLLFLAGNNTCVPNTLADPGAPRVLDDDRTGPPSPPPAAPFPAAIEPRAAPNLPNLHVQMAVADGRTTTSMVGSPSLAADALGRLSGSFGESLSVNMRLEQLIDKFDRVTDPNLFILPEVRTTRFAAFDAMIPAVELQSGILFELSSVNDSLPGIFAVTVADAGLESPSAVLAAPQPQWQDEHLAAEQRVAEALQAARAEHLAAMGRAASQTQDDASAATDKAVAGKAGFSARLKATARQAVAGLVPRA